jgi:hypothetical protein
MKLNVLNPPCSNWYWKSIIAARDTKINKNQEIRAVLISGQEFLHSKNRVLPVIAVLTTATGLALLQNIRR